MIKSYIAAEEIPAYRFVKFSSDGAAVAVSSSDLIAGVSEENTRDAESMVDVYLPGHPAYITAGGTFSAGAVLTADEEGRAVEGSSSDNIGALALEPAEAEGDVVQVLITLQRNAETSTDDTTDEDTSTDEEETTDDTTDESTEE